MDYGVNIMLIHFFAASTYFVAACQAPVFPEEIMQQIVLYFHHPSHRCVNTYWREKVVVHIDWPIRLNMSGKKDMSSFFNQLKNYSMKMYGTWILSECHTYNFHHLLKSIGQIEHLDVQFLNVEPYMYDNICELKNHSTLKNLSMSCIAKQYKELFYVNYTHLVDIISTHKALQKFSFHVSTWEAARWFLMAQDIKNLKKEIRRNFCLSELAFTIERNVIRVRPWHEEDMKWFEFVCSVKQGEVKVEKTQAASYWSGNAQQHV